MDGNYRQSLFTAQPPDRHRGYVPSTDRDITPTVLVLWECFLEILAVIIYLILAQHKIVRYILLFVAFTAVTNAILMLNGPIQDMNTFYLNSKMDEYKKQQSCKSLTYFLYTTLNYSLWVAVAWMIARVVSSYCESISLFRNALKSLSVVLIIQSMFIFIILNYFNVSPGEKSQCLNFVLFPDGQKDVSLYFFVSFGLPVFTFLALNVYAIFNFNGKKLTSKNYSQTNLKSQDVNSVYKYINSVAIQSIFFIFMVAPACAYMVSLVGMFKDNSFLTDPALRNLTYELLFYKYAYANLVLYCNALLHLILQVLTKQKLINGNNSITTL